MIYANIQRLCEEKGMSVTKLEKECGFGNATIRGWRGSSPYVYNLKKVADYFGVTVDDLISKKGE